MNKTEFINTISEKLGMSKKDTDVVLSATLDTIMETVASGEKVQLVGFGSFEKRHREAREGRNPKDGTPIRIEATDVPAFKAGKNFTEMVKE